MHKLDARPTSLTKNEVVHAAIKAALDKSYDAEHWEFQATNIFNVLL